MFFFLYIKEIKLNMYTSIYIQQENSQMSNLLNSNFHNTWSPLHKDFSWKEFLI